MAKATGPWFKLDVRTEDGARLGTKTLPGAITEEQLLAVWLCATWIVDTDLSKPRKDKNNEAVRKALVALMKATKKLRESDDKKKVK